MIYYVLNKSGILDPILETLCDKYFESCVIYWNGSAWDKIKEPPFFSDKWLLVISARDLMIKENKRVLENRYCDIICEVSSDDELNKASIYCMGIIEDFCLDCGKSINKLMKSWNLDRAEFESLLEDFRKRTVLSSYKVTENYLKTYIKWWLFTREGNQHGIDDKISPGARWQRAKELELNTTMRLNLDTLVSLVKSNESKLLTVLNLVGIDILSLDFLMKSGEYFTKPKYVTVNNFPLYLFSKDSKKKKDILNIVYSYRHNSNILKKSILDWCSTFEEIHKAFSRGELSVKNKDEWFSNRGYELRINTKFKANLWWKCINTISLEKIFIIKENLNKNSFRTYEYVVQLCRKEL